MKTLDKYIAKNFLIGYAISFCVLVGLRIIIDLFVNLDEFTEKPNLDTLAVIKNIFIFYGLNITVYFRDFAGMIMVVAASFSLGKMVRSNELVTVMASGVSLKRVIVPIVFLAILLTGLLVINQEFIIPPLSNKLVRDRDDIPGQESYDVWFMNDSDGWLICSRRFEVETSTLHKPTIITRTRKVDSPIYEVTGLITADEQIYNADTKKWDLINGRAVKKGAIKGAQPINSYDGDIAPKDIPVRRKSEYKNLLSWRQLANLAEQAAQGAKITDRRQLFSEKHFRVTEPIINLTMLMVCLPILVCRDPKSMKSAVMVSFSMVGVCFVMTFICKMFAPEANSFYGIGFWAWLPVFIFIPIAFIELDSMKT